MNTISEKTTKRAAFKKTQLLPLLTPEMTQCGQATALPGIWPRLERSPAPHRAARASTVTRLPQPLAAENTAERIFFGLLGLSAAVGVGQMFAAMIELSPNWPMFEAWLARLLG